METWKTLCGSHISTPQELLQIEFRRSVALTPYLVRKAIKSWVDISH